MTPESFMSEELRTPFAWESLTDCAHTVDRWCALHGQSPIAAVGLDFASEIEAEKILYRLPLPIWVGRAMRAAGYRKTTAPMIGDVAVVAGKDPTRWIIAPAILGELGWLFRSETGLTCFGKYARVLGAWRVAT